MNYYKSKSKSKYDSIDEYPKIYIKDSKDKLSFRCFALDEKKHVFYLPAFGDLTGGYPCKNSFRKWAIISDQQIVQI